MLLLGVPTFSFHVSASGPRITPGSNALALSSPIEIPHQRGTVPQISPLAPNKSTSGIPMLRYSTTGETCNPTDRPQENIFEVEPQPLYHLPLFLSLEWERQLKSTVYTMICVSNTMTHPTSPTILTAENRARSKRLLTDFEVVVHPSGVPDQWVIGHLSTYSF